MQVETPDFIQPSLWPPNGRDANPGDYKTWSVLQEEVYIISNTCWKRVVSSDCGGNESNFYST